MTTKHLDLGCGKTPRNPYGREEAHGIDLGLAEGIDTRYFHQANLAVEPIPYPDSYFDSVSAFDFLEHIPRILATPGGCGTRLPFVELMNEIHRVLKPGGLLYAVTPVYPAPECFQDPTHVNILTFRTWQYFCAPTLGAQIYGFVGNFQLLRNEWAMHPEAFSAGNEMSMMRRFKRWRRARRGALSHLLWEFACVKPWAE
jgi:SAM-dependent methyltransferase